MIKRKQVLKVVAARRSQGSLEAELAPCSSLGLEDGECFCPYREHPEAGRPLPKPGLRGALGCPGDPTLGAGDSSFIAHRDFSGA